MELPVWLLALGGLAAVIALLDRVIGPGLRWFFRKRLYHAVEDLNQRLDLQIKPFKLMRRKELIARLVYDPDVAKAAAAHQAETGMPRDLVLQQVEAYAREICPSFSAAMYFSFGARISRWISRALYRVRLGYFDEAGLKGVSPDASVVFVMNHKSNIDYLLVTYLASSSSALSYAVGEWARIWPLSKIIRAMGAYFIRRRDRDALYRAVLRRYVQMATEGGVAQAIFPEGGLSRDGRLGAPKLGLISYIVEGFSPEDDRDVVFVPVGLNYDRVLEDRILISARDGRDGKARFAVSLWTSFAFIGGYAVGRLFGRSHRFGYACVSFGKPLSLKEFMRETRGEDSVAALGRALGERIGDVVPALPTPIIATVLLEQGDAPITGEALKVAAVARMEHLRAEGAHVHVPRADFEYAVEVGLRMLTRRRIVTATPEGYRAIAGEAELLTFYANSLAHLPAAGGKARSDSATPSD